MFSVIGEGSDTLEIRLRWGPSKPDMTLSLQSVFYLSFGREPFTLVPGAWDPILDRITATTLMPSDDPWPPRVPLEIARTPELPPLLWVRAEGPTQLDVVAAIATVSEEARR